MRYKFFILILIFVSFSCKNDTNKIKYDYIYKKTGNDEIHYGSIITTIYPDTIYKFHYYDLDSSFVIKDIEKYQNLTKEPYENNYHKLYGVIILKTNVSKGDEWKTKYDNDFHDSLTVQVQDIINDTFFMELKTKQCYAYYLTYNNEFSGEDFLDFKIYFDPIRKIILKKEYFFDGKLKGTELIVNEALISESPTGVE